MLKRVILKTKGMYANNDKSDPDYDLWQQIADYMDGEDVIVADSRSKPGSYVLLGLANQEKEKELFWMMEQDSMVGRYVGDRVEFDKAWESGDYDADFINLIEERFVEMVCEP